MGPQHPVHRERCRLSLLRTYEFLSWRPASYGLADFPLMAKRIEDPAQTPAVLVGHLGGWSGTSPDRLHEGRVRIINQQQGPASRAADRPWAEPRAARPAR